jgi:hypothetical protein
MRYFTIIPLLVGLASADFHVFGESQGSAVNDARFQIIGASSDTLQNKCSGLNGDSNGRGVQGPNALEPAAQVNHGSGVFDFFSFSLLNVCGTDSLTFTKAQDEDGGFSYSKF